LPVGIGVPAARLFSAVVERGLGPSAAIEAMTAGSMGMSLFGVVVLGAAAVIGVAAWRRDAVPIVLDTLAPGIPVAIAFGRLGCLCAGCCHGAPTLFPIALVFEDFDSAARPIGVPLHATQLYEALGCLLVLGLSLRPGPRPRGQRFAETLLGYALVRLAVEPLRGDFRGDVGGWSSTLATAAVLAVTAALLLVGQRASDEAEAVPNTNRS
jgi:phosphatidylglycerol:prolipoprotein diacylglycerol transferase